MSRDYVRDEKGRFAETSGSDQKESAVSGSSKKLSSAMSREESAKRTLQSLQSKGGLYWESKEYKEASKEFKAATAARQKAIREAKKLVEIHSKPTAKKSYIVENDSLKKKG